MEFHSGPPGRARCELCVLRVSLKWRIIINNAILVGTGSKRTDLPTCSLRTVDLAYTRS